MTTLRDAALRCGAVARDAYEDYQGNSPPDQRCIHDQRGRDIMNQSAYQGAGWQPGWHMYIYSAIRRKGRSMSWLGPEFRSEATQISFACFAPRAPKFRINFDDVFCVLRQDWNIPQKNRRNDEARDEAQQVASPIHPNFAVISSNCEATQLSVKNRKTLARLTCNA